MWTRAARSRAVRAPPPRLLLKLQPFPGEEMNRRAGEQMKSPWEARVMLNWSPIHPGKHSVKQKVIRCRSALIVPCNLIRHQSWIPTYSSPNKSIGNKQVLDPATCKHEGGCGREKELNVSLSAALWRSELLLPELIHGRIPGWKMCGSSPCLFCWVGEGRGRCYSSRLETASLPACEDSRWEVQIPPEDHATQTCEWTSSGSMAQRYCCRKRCLGNTFRIFGWRSRGRTKYQILNS